MGFKKHGNIVENTVKPTISKIGVNIEALKEAQNTIAEGLVVLSNKI